MKKQETRPRVYSYIRFSTPEQSMGHSEQRQLEAAEAWAKRKGLQLYEQKIDRGLSGYHGLHRKKGALGNFLKQVEEGLIPPGSILLVENIDRLSREGAKDVLESIIFQLWKHGITLQTLGPEETYGPDCDNKPAFLALLLYIQRAREESKRKSDLIRAARQHSFAAARATGRIVTARCPAWLRKVSDSKFEVIPEAATTVKLIFEWKLQGLSQRRLEAKLNAEATWRPPPQQKTKYERGDKGNGWRTSYIKKILENRAVIGEYQPHQKINEKREIAGPPIKGYYPIIIDDGIFYAVQQQLAANKGKGGCTGKKSNIFTHIAKCGYCGSPMRYTNKGMPTWRYLVCDRAARGISCECHTVRYAEVLELVLDGCSHITPEQVLPNPDDQVALIKELLGKVKEGETELMSIKEEIDNYMAQIGRTKSPKMRDEYEALVEKRHQQEEVLTTTIEKNKHELDNVESGAKKFKNWKQSLAKLTEAIADEKAVDLRVRLANHLREFIDSIEFFPVGFKTVADRSKHFIIKRGAIVAGRNGHKHQQPAKRYWLPHVETIVETLEDGCSEIKPRPPKKVFAEFEHYVLKRRMSKEGRFYRIRFKNGERIDLVPQGGLATGLRVMKGSVEKVLPDFESLWVDFQKSRDKLF